MYGWVLMIYAVGGGVYEYPRVLPNKAACLAKAEQVKGPDVRKTTCELELIRNERRR